jgi:hypothetical protein
LISLTPVNGSWKITGLELLEEKRIDPLGKKVKSGVRLKGVRLKGVRLKEFSVLPTAFNLKYFTLGD